MLASLSTTLKKKKKINPDMSGWWLFPLLKVLLLQSTTAFGKDLGFNVFKRY